MKTFVINTDLIYYASRYEEDIAFSKMLGDDFKKSSNERKASKIIVEFSKPTDRLHIYTKPRYMIKDYCGDGNMVYVGIFNTDDSVLDEDYADIQDFCEKKNIIPIFGNKPSLGRVIKEILEGQTYRHIFPKNQLEMWEEYLKFNEEVCDKIRDTCKPEDIIWIQDHNCFLVPEFIDNQNIITSFNLPFTSLVVSIPYYKRIMSNLVKSKAVSFFDSCGKLTFIEQSAPFTMETGHSPIATIHSFGTDVDLLDDLVCAQEYQACGLFNDIQNLIVLPYNSPNHLLCIEAYLNKYETPINVLLLNLGDIDLEAQVEVQRLIEHLKITYRLNIATFLPRNDVELFKIIGNSKIGFVKNLKGYFYYFNKHFIADPICDYEEVAAHIFSLLKGGNKKTSPKFIEPGTAKKHLTTPNCIKERMLSFALPQTLIDFKHLDANRSRQFISENTLEKGTDGYPRKLMLSDEDKHDLSSDLSSKTTLEEDSNVINKSREIQVTEVNSKSEEFSVKHIDKLLNTVRNTEKLVLLLDYDGTLTPLVSNPDNALPSDRLLEILDRLNEKKTAKVFIVSGRSQKDLDRFIPKEIDCFAEHGTFRRTKGNWSQLKEITNMELPYNIAKFYTERTPNSTLEKKSNGFVFHYRNCDFDIGKKQAMSLLEQLKRIDSTRAKSGKMIVEFRSGGKQDALNYITGDLIIAAGDDVTDEDMFASKDVVSIKVGKEKSKAHYFVEDVNEMINFLDLISKNI